MGVAALGEAFEAVPVASCFCHEPGLQGLQLSIADPTELISLDERVGIAREGGVG